MSWRPPHESPNASVPADAALFRVKCLVPKGGICSILITAMGNESFDITSFRKSFSLFLLSSVLLLLSALLYRLTGENIPTAHQFRWQFNLLLGLSLFLSLAMALWKRCRYPFIAVKTGILFLLIFPLDGELWIGMFLLLSLWLETAFYIAYPWNSLAMSALLVYGTLLFMPRSAFHTELSGPGLYELVSFVVLGVFLVALLGLLTGRDRQLREERKMIKRLDEALNTMGKANLGFQSYSSSLELETLKRERKRVSREIHDTVGYSLTNIRIMLEAAGMMINSDKPGAEELIKKSMDEAGFCLEETRRAMRLLRSKEIGRPEGLRAFFKLVSAFAEATGISVKVEFGNSPDSFGPRIDRAVFRFIQEGLTNSFRHGRASEIRIYFWIENRILRLSLQDNGSGAVELKEGIGLTGMQERLNDLGGSIKYQNITDGFELSVTIPLPDSIRSSV